MSFKYPAVAIFTFCLTILLTCSTSGVEYGPFPVKGPIFDGDDKPFGTAHVYPRFVEIFDEQERQVGRVGIMVEEGVAKLFLVNNDQNSTLVGYATKGQIYNQNDRITGSYFATSTWSFIYDTKGKRAGKVRCIAWPRVCAVGVGGFLLNLFGAENENTP